MSVPLDSPEMQAKSLALMVTHPQVLTTHRGNISSSWYDSREAQVVAESILSFYDKYKRPPKFSELSFYVKQFHCKTVEDKNKYIRLIRGLRTHAKSDLSFVKDQFTEFIKFHTYRSMVLASLSCLEKGDLDTIPSLFRKSLGMMNKTVSPIEYFEDPYTRLVQSVPRYPIPTGIKGVDDAMEGGPALGELTVVHAFTNVGKTTFVVNMVAHAAKVGHRCLHMTTEESDEQIASRYDVRYLGKHRDTIRKFPKKSASRLKKIGKKGGSIQIVGVAGWTVSDVRGFIYQNIENLPSVVVVDYPDKLIPIHRYSDRRHEIAIIYYELINMAKEFNFQLVVPSQSNAEGFNAKKVELIMLSEAKEKGHIADNVLALCQTEQEALDDKMRVFISKARNVPSKMQIDCMIFRNLMKIVDESEYVRMKANVSTSRFSGKSSRAKSSSSKTGRTES